jgi:hypothetical protein
MADGLPHVVVTYAEFLERRQRRSRVASELTRRRATEIRPFGPAAKQIPGAEQRFRTTLSSGVPRIGEMRDTLTCRILPRAVLPVGVTSLFPTRSS